MTRTRVKSDAKRKLLHYLSDHGSLSQDNQDDASLRKSARLRASRKPPKHPESQRKHTKIAETPPSPPISNIPPSRECSHVSDSLPEAPRKHKREREGEPGVEHTHAVTQDQPPSKRVRESPLRSGVEKRLDRDAAFDVAEDLLDPVQYWALTKRWPKEYFEDSHLTRDQISQELEDSWLEESMGPPAPDIKYVEVNGFRLPCPIRKLPTSVRRKQSDSSLNSSEDTKNRDTKSAPYRTAQYTTLLAAKGSYMHESDGSITQGSKELYQRLLQSDQVVPMDSLFREDLFKKTCRKIEDRNESRVIQDIARLIVPSVETLATYGATELDYLIEGVNETWTGNIAVEGPLPKPDYSVGFRRTAFTEEQLKKLDPLIGSVYEKSLFVATFRMYFPFFTCEVKCGAAALDIADRQNAHSMTVALRAMIELFRSVKREKELNRRILAFSVSHDHSFVKIYGHYPVIEAEKAPTYYRHFIHGFSFAALDGKEKWTAYKFVNSLYHDHALELHTSICSVIDDLPDVNFDLSQTASFPGSLPQGSQPSNASSIGEKTDQMSVLASQQQTPTTLFTQVTEPASKKPRT